MLSTAKQSCNTYHLFPLLAGQLSQLGRLISRHRLRLRYWSRFWLIVITVIEYIGSSLLLSVYLRHQILELVLLVDEG